ncbi:MAG: thiamine pyrophosphate-binding protein [Chloroflexi bacterium]|nr:thiamine pyrophosphate-binding protein [Chloroflexota bacterium]
MTQMPAPRAVIEALRAEGVDHVFGLVGTTINSILGEMYGREDIRFVDTRHEEGAAFMAYGYARASGKPVACLTTSGPGATNTMTGVALAYKGHAPVVVITGDTAMEHLNRDGSQAFDLVNLFKPITLMSAQVTMAQRIPETLHNAFRTALSGKKGPVFVDIPRDLLEGPSIEYDAQSPGAYRTVDWRIGADPRAVRRAAELLAQAERPLLLAGGGIIDSEASEEAVQLAEFLDMALVPSYGHHDAVPNSHRLYVGPPGGRGSGEAAEAMAKADVILALGSRLNQPSTGWNYNVIQRGAKIIQIDIDPAEIGRNYPVRVGMVGDAQTAARQLLEALREQLPEGRANPGWRGEIEALAARRRARLASEASLGGDPMMPQRVYTELRKALPTDCMVTIDAGVAPGLAYDRLEFESPRTMFNYAQHGGLGMGYCVGLGTKVGRPERPALSITGDGGFLYTSQELNTAVRWKIPLVCLVLNNSCLGAEKAQQQRRYDGRYIGVDLTNPRFDKLAEVYGAKGYYVERPQDIAETVKEALAQEGPSVIEVPVAEYFPEGATAGIRRMGGG